MLGSAQEIRYINRDENTHLWLFRNIIKELQSENPASWVDSLSNANSVKTDFLKQGLQPMQKLQV